MRSQAFAQATMRSVSTSRGRGSLRGREGRGTVKHQVVLGVALAFLLGILPAVVMPAETGITTRVSVDSSGYQGNSYSRGASINADGRYVAFSSWASNLVTGITSPAGQNVFVHDRQTSQTALVSVDSAGNWKHGFSEFPSISADGRYVAFQSDANFLVPEDNNVYRDIFVHDRQTRQTTRVSVDSAGNAENSDSWYPSISADGRYVAFTSDASNLVPGDTNNAADVFVHDRQTGQTTRESIDSAGNQGTDTSIFPSISADGRYVAFHSIASNLVPGDTNNDYDVFLHDRQTGQTIRVSVDSTGNQVNGGTNPSISADGHYVAFDSDASNLVPGDTNGYPDVFVHDRQTGQTTRVSVDSAGYQGNFGSGNPSISADGRYVAFHSIASNLVPGDTNTYDVFVHDRQTGQTTRVSVDSAGYQGNFGSGNPSISADGRYVAFDSDASNLVPGDTNGYSDVFVHQLPTPDAVPPTVISTVPDSNVSGVSVSAPITVTFSEIMDQPSFSPAAFVLTSGGLNVTWTVNVSGATATFTPFTQLMYSTTYNAIVTTVVKDLAGNAMVAEKTWSFTTEPNPVSPSTAGGGGGGGCAVTAKGGSWDSAAGTILLLLLPVVALVARKFWVDNHYCHKADLVKEADCIHREGSSAGRPSTL